MSLKEVFESALKTIVKSEQKEVKRQYSEKSELFMTIQSFPLIPARILDSCFQVVNTPLSNALWMKNYHSI
ncbi:MAG: hypothetical protein ACJAY2_000939 [Pseudomonadales bacterium]|jgi:hypothetical protein